MSSVCGGGDHQQLKFHSSHHFMKKPTIEIPPRRLLSKKLQENPHFHHPHHPHPHHHNHQQLHGYCGEFGGMQNEFDSFDSSDFDEHSVNPYATDHFRMFEFKIRRCTRSRSHDWTDCPFAHPGEKARRRDPRRFQYSGAVCSEFRRGGSCNRGDDCEFAHGVFECWLHPARYRTEPCKDGRDCKRKVCFFAHTPQQLRVLPSEMAVSGSDLSSAASPPMSSKMITTSTTPSKSSSRCCLLCRSMSDITHSSPTSTLLGFSRLSRSPSLSPPLSPVNKQRSSIGVTNSNSLPGFSSISRLSKYNSNIDFNYKDMLNELLMNSLEEININDSCSSSSPMSSAYNNNGIANRNGNIPNWIDFDYDFDYDYNNCFNTGGDHHIHHLDFDQQEDHHHQQDHHHHLLQLKQKQKQQQQFVVSPSAENNTVKGRYGDFSSSSKFINGGGGFFGKHFEKSTTGGGSDHDGCSGGGSDPDLGWVNDLLT